MRHAVLAVPAGSVSRCFVTYSKKWSFWRARTSVWFVQRWILFTSKAGAHYKPLKKHLTHPTTCHVCVDTRFTWYQVPESMLHRESKWLKNHIFPKKCIFISFWIFKYCFYYSFTLYNCVGCWIFSRGLPSRCQTVCIQVQIVKTRMKYSIRWHFIRFSTVS